MQEGPPALIAGFDPHPAGHAGYLYGVSGVALGELLFYLPGFLPGHDAARSWTVNAARHAARLDVTLQVLPAVAHPATGSEIIIADEWAYAEHAASGFVYTGETVTALARIFDNLTAAPA